MSAKRSLYGIHPSVERWAGSAEMPPEYASPSAYLATAERYVEEMVKDPQINHRQMIVEADHPKFGKVKQFGIAIKLSDTPGSVRHAAPTSGEQTEDVLKSLGMTAEAIAALRKQAVIE